jgi:hypothetical protein
MSQITLQAASLREDQRPSDQMINRSAAIILVLEPALFFAAFGVLANAIDWPASLGLPYNEILPAIAAKLGEVRLGYGLYLASSLLTAVMAVLLLARRSVSPIPLSLQFASLFLILAAIFKAMGIVRWMVAMPALANHVAAHPEAALATEAAFIALNEYAGGGLGEWLGVGLMSGLWMIALAVALHHINKGIALAFAVGGLAALAIVVNEFTPVLETFILQASSRSLAMLAQFWLAFLLWRGRTIDR